jgi:type II secretory pathway component PulJ
MRKISESGFTLVEVVVVGVLAAALAFGAFSIFMMYSDSSRETTAKMRMQRQNEALMDEIGRHVRASGNIVRLTADSAWSDEGLDFVEFDDEGVVIPVDSVVSNIGFALYDVDGNLTRSYRFSNGIVEQRITSASGTVIDTFSIDGAPVRIIADSLIQPRFVIRGLRIQITAGLTYVLQSGRETYKLPVERGTFQCRL